MGSPIAGVDVSRPNDGNCAILEKLLTENSVKSSELLLVSKLPPVTLTALVLLEPPQDDDS